MQHIQAQIISSKNAPAIEPMTIPAIAPPLSPPLLSEALAPIRSAPSVPTGAVKPSVVVGAEVAVTVLAPLLVPRTPGVAAASVPVAVMATDELSATHSPSWHSCAASQQRVPHFVSPMSALQVPVLVAAASWLLHTEVIVDRSVSVSV